MTLETAIKQTPYKVQRILSLEEEITTRFYKLGIFPGVKIVLKRKAPLFSDPLLFEVEGAQIALTKKEASYLEVISSEEDLCQQ